jgi:hypothetical protein
MFDCSPLKHSLLCIVFVTGAVSFPFSTTNAELSELQKTNIIAVVFLAGDDAFCSATHRSTARKLAVLVF